jgi:hypothetical protein
MIKPVSEREEGNRAFLPVTESKLSVETGEGHVRGAVLVAVWGRESRPRRQRQRKLYQLRSGKPRKAAMVPGGRLPQSRASERQASMGGPSRTFTGIKVGMVVRFRHGLWRAECVTKGAWSGRGRVTGDRGLKDLTAPVVYSTRWNGCFWIYSGFNNSLLCGSI